MKRNDGGLDWIFPMFCYTDFKYKRYDSYRYYHVMDRVKGINATEG